MSIQQKTRHDQSEHDAFLAEFRECKAQWQRRHDAALRCEPLAGRRDARRFNPYGF